MFVLNYNHAVQPFLESQTLNTWRCPPVHLSGRPPVRPPVLPVSSYDEYLLTKPLLRPSWCQLLLSCSGLLTLYRTLLDQAECMHRTRCFILFLAIFKDDIRCDSSTTMSYWFPYTKG
jgi:hypothetical protein